MKLEKDHYGRTELTYAIIDHETKKALHLLRSNINDIDVNDKDWAGCSNLYFAAEACEVEVVKELLKFGADPNIMTTVGVSALSAALSGSTKFAKNHGYERAYEIVKMLLAAGADPDQKSNSGWTMRTLSKYLAPGKISDYVCAYPNVEQETEPEAQQEPDQESDQEPHQEPET